MNTFDSFVLAIALVAVVMGFSSGLLRSLATILAWLVAAAAAIELTPSLAAFALGQNTLSADKAWIAFFVVFGLLGIVLGALFRAAVNEFAGPEVGLFDRFAGAALGAVRIVLIAVLLVVVFDRIIPAGREPAFLVGSKLRPVLSAAGQLGLRSLPPEVEDYIDRLKRDRGL